MAGRMAAGVLGLVALAGSAAAQALPTQPAPTGNAAQKPTLLHLSATGTVQVPQDLLVADLVAQATEATPAAAQRKVNTMTASALQQAKTVASVDARAMSYAVTPADDGSGPLPTKRARWTARQTLELRGTDGPSLLELAGRLQDAGLAAASLDWQLSPAARRHAYEAATTDALKQVQARATAAADTLGLHLGRYADVRLDDGGSPIGPRMQAQTLMKSEAAPVATSAPEDVSATVSVDVELKQ